MCFNWSLSIGYDTMEATSINDITVKFSTSLLYETNRFNVAVRLFTKQCQNVVRISVTHLPHGLYAIFLFSSNFGVTCDLLLNRCMATLELCICSISYHDLSLPLTCDLLYPSTLGKVVTDSMKNYTVETILILLSLTTYQRASHEGSTICRRQKPKTSKH